MRRLITVLAVALVLAGGWLVLRACGPDFVVAVFTYAKHPDFPRERFLEGRLGVLQPTYARSYFVVAYRHLTSVGFTAPEREQVRGYWEDRGSAAWDQVDADWLGKWRAARNRVPGVPRPPERLLGGGTSVYSPETHAFTLNCVDDAFRTARHTLEERSRRYGAASKEVREWVTAQNQVFDNCDSAKANIPGPLDTRWPLLLRQDREYQIAAAHFYARQEKTAAEEFARIGEDKASPWRPIANYLVLRAAYRSDGSAGLKHIEGQADRIQADPTLASVHAMTESLLSRYRIRARDQASFERIARRLASEHQDDGLRDDLYAYTTLWDNLLDETGAVEKLRSPDLTDWIRNMQCLAGSCGEYSYRQWKKTSSLPWLIAALANASPDAAQARELIEAGETVTATSPGFDTVTFHRLRLAIALGRGAQVRETIDRVLADPKLPKSAANAFRSLGMRAAPDMSGFLRFALQPPVMLTWSSDGGEVTDFMEPPKEYPISELRFDHASVKILNERTPLRLLSDAALGDSLPESVRRDFVLTTFTRAAMLEERATAVKLAVRLGEVAPAVSTYAEAYRQAGDESRFAAAFLLLHAPEARPYYASGVGRQTRPGKIDNFRDNWWCPVSAKVEVDAVEFLSDADRKTARSELEKLTAVGAGPDALGAIALAFARAHPDDPRIPEALHLAVRAARYGCDRVKVETTRNIFRLLHTRYPNSEWARKTPIWQ
jgi:hypothetical protein